MESIINRLYYEDGEGEETPTDAVRFPLSEKIRTRVLERLSQKGYDVNKEIDTDLFEHTFKPLKGAIEKSLGTPEFGTPDRKFLQELEHNAAVFSAFKTHRQQRELHAMLFDKNGNKKSFDRFRRDTQKILKNYNVNWLQTEYETAVTRARFARDYREYARNKDLYPNLEWLPSTSANPREAHKPFYHTIHKIGDDFFNSHYPGSLWRCQCSVKSTNAPVTSIHEESVTIPAQVGLDENPGISAKVFTDSHPFMKANKQTENLVHTFVNSYEEGIEFTRHKEFKNGGRVLIHDEVDKKKSDYKDLLTIAIEAAKQGESVKLLPSVHVKSPQYERYFGHLIGTQYEGKCPDMLWGEDRYYEYEGYIGEWRKNKVRRMISHGIKQSDKIIIKNNNGASDRFIRKSIMQRIETSKSIAELWLYEKGKIRKFFHQTK